MPVPTARSDDPIPHGGARPPLRLSAAWGAFACLAWAVAFFLPWIEVSARDRDRLGRAFEPRIQEIEQASPTDAEGCRALLDQVVSEGSLGGLDLLHYARRAAALHCLYEGDEPSDEASGGPWPVRRAFRLFGVLLAGLPIASVLLAVVLVAGRFRRLGAPSLAALLVLGAVGGALALAGLRISQTITSGGFAGLGLKLGMAASVAQTAAGVLGVGGRTWWRAYLGALLALAVLGGLAWAYVVRGALP